MQHACPNFSLGSMIFKGFLQAFRNKVDFEREVLSVNSIIRMKFLRNIFLQKNLLFQTVTGTGFSPSSPKDDDAYLGSRKGELGN